MNFPGYRCALRRLMMIVIAGGALAICPMAPAAENLPAPQSSPASSVDLVVKGASAGITTDYFEQAVSDALVASGIFSGVIDAVTDDGGEMDMIGASGTFPGIENDSGAPYLLDIRIVKVETPSFNIWMTVGMKAVWTLYRTAGKTALLQESVSSTYTGSAFEGGVIGANRVRVAMEGATRENIRIGIDMLASVDLEQE